MPRSIGDQYTAISRKVVGKSARDKGIVGGFLKVHCSSKKFERMAEEAMGVCLRVLKEINKSRFDSYSVRNSVLINPILPFGIVAFTSFSDNLSRILGDPGAVSRVGKNGGTKVFK